MNNYGINQRNAIGTLGRHGSFTSGTCGAGSSENRESGEVVPTMDSSAAWTDACVRPGGVPLSCSTCHFAISLCSPCGTPNGGDGIIAPAGWPECSRACAGFVM